MRTLVIAILLAGSSPISAFAQPANDGEPFGTQAVVPVTPVNDNVHTFPPGTLDEGIMEALSDQSGEGDIRGHGRDAAPGQVP
jgi:hypothetical protein